MTLTVPTMSAGRFINSDGVRCPPLLGVVFKLGLQIFPKMVKLWFNKKFWILFLHLAHLRVAMLDRCHTKQQVSKSKMFDPWTIKGLMYIQLTTLWLLLSGQALPPRSRVLVFKIWDTGLLSEKESWGFEQFLCMPQSLGALGALKDSLLLFLSLWCLWLSQWLLDGPVSRVLKSF